MPEVSDLLSSKYAPQLQQLFNFYAKLEDPDIDQETLASTITIQAKSFHKFADNFKIVPDIVSGENIDYIFNNVLKNKPGYTKERIKALSYEDFIESISRICIVGKYNLGVSPEEGAEEKKEDTTNSFNLKGMNAGVIEKLLKMLGLTLG